MAYQSTGRKPIPRRDPVVEYDPTELGSRYAEARQRGVGVEPGAGANSKLLRDATRGPSNPFADLGKFISGLFKKK